jgi:sugar lactone lactonase YvrE
MTATYRAERVLDGIVFGEGPRWRDGRLVFSDMHDHRVVALDPSTGDAQTVCSVPTQPSGLGWLPDGRMLVVSMTDRSVLRLEGDALVQHADLSGIEPFQCNDMVVGPEGRAYVGGFGFDIHRPDLDADSVRTTSIAVVEADGTASVAASDMGFPNGMVLSPDGRTLVVGESMAGCLTAFDVAPDGALSGRREFARVAGHVPDGICLDAEGAVWMSCPMCNLVLRVREGGDVAATVQVSDHAYACMLGGADRRTLFVCVAGPHADPDTMRTRHSGTIEAAEVDVPGAGWP